MLICIIWFSVSVLYFPVFAQLYSTRWVNIDYTHAYFILPVSLWLIWRKRSDLKAFYAQLQCPDSNLPTPNSQQTLIGFCLFFFGLLMFIFGWRLEYLLVSTLSLIPLLMGLVVYLYGLKMARALLFPILYLLLLVPPPLGVLDSVTIPMRYGVSTVATEILKIFQFPVIRNGLLMSIGGKEVFMGPACSGFRSLITMISLGAVYAYISKGSKLHKWILLSLVIPLALLGNLIRVTGMCLVTFYLGEAAGGKFHDYGGFVIFIVLILGLVGLDDLLNRRSRSKSG